MTRIAHRRALVVGALALAAAGDCAAAGPTLVLNSAGAPPYTNPEGTGFVDRVAGEAFRRAGATFQLVHLPAERALRLADEGRIDGELARIRGIEKRYLNLVRVPVKLYHVGFAAFSKDRSIPGTLAALRGYRVGLIRGWKFHERLMADAGDVVTVSDPEQLFELLELGRIDVALYERAMGLALVRARGMEGVHLLSPLLAERDVFMYLNQRHAALVPALAAALRELKRDGFYERVRREALGPFVGSAR